jgi:hypothetical protein
MTRIVMTRVTEGFIEEGCEIVGTTCLLIAFTEYFQREQSAADSLPSSSKKKMRASHAEKR